VTLASSASVPGSDSLAEDSFPMAAALGLVSESRIEGSFEEASPMPDSDFWVNLPTAIPVSILQPKLCWAFTGGGVSF
jgi:hypothetical protein